MTLKIDFRVAVVVLLAIIVAMLLVWQPWSAQPDAKARTIQVTGETKLSAVPDEFIFYPMYQFEGGDKAAALKQLSDKSDEVTAKLKALGVPASKIATNSNGYDSSLYSDSTTGLVTYSLNLTVTVSDKAKAQKVQDYLVTTQPVGAISPQAGFSDAKRKELEAGARDAATQEARKKAEQSAKNLGFRLGAVKSVDDGSGFGDVYPLMSADSARGSAVANSETKLSVQPGENDLSYRVTVVYYIR